MKEVVIMRGLPGSGKTYHARRVLSSAGRIICSADDFHIMGKEYVFIPANIGLAHEHCLREFMRHAQPEHDGICLVVVDNTNLQAWEIAAYYRLAELWELPVRIVTMMRDFVLCCNDNVHGVPTDRMWQMHQTLLSERLPPVWKQEFVFRK